VKHRIQVLVCVATLAATMAEGQTLLGLSLGAGYGGLKEDFNQGGSAATLLYSGPAVNIEAELIFGDLYANMALGLIVMPAVTLAGAVVDTTGYETNLGFDFTALGLGYQVKLSERLKAGAAIGFHVSGPSMTPPGEDSTKVGFGGYYGLIGVDLIPRVRYSFGDNFALTLGLPLGLDFSAMSTDVVVFGQPTGATSPAIVTPSTLQPKFFGLSYGLYLSLCYLFPSPF